MTGLEILMLVLGSANLIAYYGFGAKEHNFYSGVAALVVCACSVSGVLG